MALDDKGDKPRSQARLRFRAGGSCVLVISHDKRVPVFCRRSRPGWDAVPHRRPRRRFVAAGMHARPELPHRGVIFEPGCASRESSRDVKLLPWVESLFKDIRSPLRMLRKHALSPVRRLRSLTLALGVRSGPLSSLIDRPHPAAPAGARGPERLVYLSFPTYSSGCHRTNFTLAAVIQRLRDSARSDVERLLTSIAEPGAGSLRNAIGRGARAIFRATRSLFWASGRLSAGRYKKTSRRPHGTLTPGASCGLW